MSIIGQLEVQQGRVATHLLHRQGQTSLAGLKHSYVQQPATHNLDRQQQTSLAGLKHKYVLQPVTF